MKNVVLKEVKKELNWGENIVVRMFSKTFIKVYNKGKEDYFRYLAK